MIDDILERFEYYRHVQLLPIATKFDYENWLENFHSKDEKEIAAHILKHFLYISDPIIDKLLQVSIGKCGIIFKQLYGTWTDDCFKQKCWYSFIQGEDQDSETDSGHIFTRKLKEELHIPSQRILKFENLFKKLEQNTSEPQNVILVDDFIGTGAQTENAWNVLVGGTNNLTLSKLVQQYGHKVIYAPLIVTHIGLENIEHNCENLSVVYVHKLGWKDSLLNPSGYCWNDHPEMFCKFIDILKRVANKEDIPQSDGMSVNDIFGFNRLGLALAFYHGIPDACPAFFYWETPTWKPLVKRNYNR